MTSPQELIEKMKAHGQYFTPTSIIRAIADFLKPSNVDSAADPGCGDGRILEYLAAKGLTTLHGFDIDPAMVSQARKRVGNKAHIARRDVLEVELPQKYDVIIANPPFSPMRTDTCKKFSTQSAHPAAQFMELCIIHLTDRGRMAIILDAGLCTNKSYREVRQKISKLADITCIVELPNTAFKKVARTTFGTYIVFLRPRGKRQSRSAFVFEGGKIKITSAEYQKDLTNGDWIPMNQGNGPPNSSVLGHFVELVSERFRNENDRVPMVYRETRMLTDDKREPKRGRRCVVGCLFLSRLAPGKYLPRCAPIMKEFHGAGTTPEYFIIRPQNLSDLPWLWYVINFKDRVRVYLNRVAAGQGRMRVSPQKLLALPLARPSKKLMLHAKRCFVKAHKVMQQIEELRQDVTK